MGTINHGNQDITYNFFEEATAEDFNKRHLDIRPRGIYKGGYLTKHTNSEIYLSLFTLEIGDDDEQISSKSSDVATINNTTLDSGTISSTTPYIVLRWAFAEQSDNYVEIHAIANVAAALTNDIIVGKIVFDGATITGFSYTDRTFLNVQDLFLKVEATPDSELYVRLRAGRIQDGSQNIFIPEQKVGPFSVPGSPNSRIDLVYIDDDGTAAIFQGSQAVSPSPPDYDDKLVVAEITIVNGDANITVNKIKDVRIFITSVPITPDYSNIFGSWTNKDSLNNTLVKDAVYKAGSDGFVTAYISADGTITAYTDSSNPPTKARTMIRRDYGYMGLMFPVKKDDYWKVSSSAPPATIHWLPIGDGTCVKQ